MQEEKRRRRIERIKIFLRILFFIKRNIKRGLILAGCLIFLSFAGYFSLQYAQAAEEKMHGNTEAQMAETEQLYLSVQLETEEKWCQKNSIIVTTDALPAEFFYSCAETGEDSGWIKENEKEVFSNGTWNVMVRDAAGNIAAAEITVSNIDKQPPVIIEIKEVTEKRSYENED